MDQRADVTEQRITELGLQLWSRVRDDVPGIFNRGYWQGRMLEWAMSDPSFKIDLLRFVDVLPTLQTPDQVAAHAKQYLLKPGRELPKLIGATIKLASGGFASGLAAKAIRGNVTEMAQRFIVGANAAEALPVLRDLHGKGYGFTVDLLGEATMSDVEADRYQQRYLDLIDNLADQTRAWPADPLLDADHLGSIPRCNVSIKVSALEEHLDAIDPIGSVDRALGRVLPLFLRAREKNVFLNLDMEQWSLNGITMDLFERIALHPQLRDWRHIGIVVQAYLRGARPQIERLLDIVSRRDAPITVRLVKGAYWDFEVVIAEQNGFDCPVFLHKSQTDANYESLTELLLRNITKIQPAFASHNLRSLTHALVRAEQLGVDPRAYEIQMLYGMAEPERAAIRAAGNRVRLYAPIGELLPGMAYLVRRLLENTSNSGFLKLSHHDKVDIHQLLTPPKPAPDQPPLSRANCPLTDFTSAAERKRFADALDRVRAAGPIAVPVVVAGKARNEGPTLDRECPSDLTRIVARVTLATAQDADTAAREAHRAWPTWRDTPVEQRAALLERLGERLTRDRAELAALQVMEVGKPQREADADVAEAIDFCHYYAKQALAELSPRQMGDVSGEDNVMTWEGRGVAAIIAPWNFPLAILTGMTTAALVAGNAAIIKPAEQSSAIAYGLYTRMIDVGFDPHLVHFLPGLGEDVGAALVDHPLVVQLAFTGSMKVGLQILRDAAIVRAGQPQIKRVVCEMGGKNAVVVDEDADLDEAVGGVLRSAFGYSGQKCSACSRVAVVGAAYESFIARLVDACRSLEIRKADDPACQLGPVIDRDAYERLTAVLASPGEGARPTFIGTVPAGLNGYFVPPAIFEVDGASHPLMRDELFGPIIAITRADSFQGAIEIANASAYKLTGAVFSRSPANLELARRAFRVGNLYLNRGSTGAIVGRQPFGGFGMSGAGTKAGGPGYLLNFVDPRVICENTLRRGVAPEHE